MRPPVKRFKPSLRDTFRANNAADRFYAAMAGVEPQCQTEIAPKRVYTKSDPAELEGAVLSDVGDLLRSHPKILFAIRQNAGAVGYVQFFRIIRRPEGIKLKMPDYWGFFTNLKPFSIECKKRSWTHVSNEREESQAAFLGMIRGLGGMGIFVSDVQQAAQAINAFTST